MSGRLRKPLSVSATERALREREKDVLRKRHAQLKAEFLARDQVRKVGYAFFECRDEDGEAA